DNDFFNIKNRDKNIKTLIEYIEHNIIHGIIKEKKEHNYTKYYLNTHNKNLELHITSSATVELLPIIVFLKHFVTLQDKLLIIEEPEAHLHPKAQIHIARFISLMVNYGIKVLITTHSDYIINELNNLIKLNFTDKDKLNQIKNCEKVLAKNNIKASKYLIYKKKEKKDIQLLSKLVLKEKSLQLKTYTNQAIKIC
ncbi:MAG: AAA family ATPase, partial [Nautiliaceae bacterium]